MQGIRRHPAGDLGETIMTAFGPAGLAIVAFIGSIGTLTAIYGLEQFFKRRIGVGR